METQSSAILWLDLETTGLDTERDHILEVAVVATDDSLRELARASFPVICSETVLRDMNTWCCDQHERSGLLAEVRSVKARRLEWCDRVLSEMVRMLGVRPALGGANVGAFDRRFLQRCMPYLNAELHYRHVDVSTLRETARRAWPLVEVPPKPTTHRALDDALASLNFYRWFVTRIGGEL